MDWLTPILSSAAVIALLEIIKWRMGVSAENKKAKEQREESLQDEYRGDLKGRVAKLETERVKDKQTIDEWQKKYFELQVLYKTLEIQNKSEKAMREQLEWRVRDLESRLNIGPDEIPKDE